MVAAMLGSKPFSLGVEPSLPSGLAREVYTPSCERVRVQRSVDHVMQKGEMSRVGITLAEVLREIVGEIVASCVLKTCHQC